MKKSLVNFDIRNCAGNKDGSCSKVDILPYSQLKQVGGNGKRIRKAAKATA